MYLFHILAESYSASRTCIHKEIIIKISRLGKYYYSCYGDEEPAYEEIQWAVPLHICFNVRAGSKTQDSSLLPFYRWKNQVTNNTGLLKVAQGIYSKSKTQIWSCCVLVSVFPKGITDKEIDANSFPKSSRISEREGRLFQKKTSVIVLEREAWTSVLPATHTYVLVILISGNVPLPGGFISLN